MLNQLQTQQVEKIVSLEKRLEQSMESQHQADKQAAIAETRCAEFEKQLAKLEEERERLKANAILQGELKEKDRR